MTRASILTACLVGLVCAVSACGQAKGPESAASGAAAPPAAGKDDGTYASHTRETQEFFERGLANSAADGETRFGEYLTVLEINPQELQAAPVDQSFKSLHDAAMRYADARIRGQMMRAFFGETIDQPKP
jgi:hypothetical protein